MKTKILGVDGNWVLHRAYHVTAKVEPEKRASSIKRLFISMCCKDAIAFKANRMLVAFDGARIFRYKVFPAYKGNREQDSSGTPYDYLEGLIEYLEYLGIPYLQNHKYEADDVLCSLAKQHTDPVGISTRDKDAYQYVRAHVTLIDSTQDPPRKVRYEDVERLFGLPPERCLDLQTVLGDKIDNIPQLVSRAKAIAGIKKHGTLASWVNAEPATFKGKKKQLAVNRTLVRLVPDIKLPSTLVKWNKTANEVAAYIAFREFANPKTKGLF